jgi:KDO2-lipid IV(A) lauroyltransferase
MQRWLEWLGVRLALGLATRLPPAAGAAFGRWLGRSAFGLGVRRRVTLDNLRLALGDSYDEAERRRLGRAAYEHLGTSLMEFLGLGRRDPAWLRDQVEVVGREHAEAALAAGRGAIAASAHYGNWEICSAGGAAHGLPVTFVVAPLRNAAVDDLVQRMRRRAGIEVLPRGMALRRLRGALEANRLVAFMCDQDARRRGVFVPLFGVPASTPKGGAQIAVRTGVPFLPVVNRRLPSGRHRVQFFPPLVPPPGDEETQVRALLAAFNRWLEDIVRQDPRQYWWAHRRWKTRPPASPEPAAPAGVPPLLQR